MGLSEMRTDQQITLGQYRKSGKELEYHVTKLKNSLARNIGDILTQKEVRDLIDQGIHVTIVLGQ